MTRPSTRWDRAERNRKSFLCRTTRDEEAGFREYEMNRFTRDAHLVIAFVVGTTLIGIGLHWAGLLPNLTVWPHDEWEGAAFLVLAEAALLALNIRSLKRGEFRWSREAAVTAVILIWLTLIFLPVWPSAREKTARSGWALAAGPLRSR